jgi:serine/threonine protein kinase
MLPLILLQSAAALAALHDRRIVHGDVQLRNFLTHKPECDSQPVGVRLAGFGFCDWAWGGERGEPYEKTLQQGCEPYAPFSRQSCFH